MKKIPIWEFKNRKIDHADGIIKKTILVYECRQCAVSCEVEIPDDIRCPRVICPTLNKITKL